MGGSNGAALSSNFNGPAALVIDGSFNVYIADTKNQRVRVLSSGLVFTLAGGASGTNAGWIDATGTNAAFALPSGIALYAPAGVLYGKC